MMSELAILLFCAALVVKLVDYVKAIFDKNVTGAALVKMLVWTGLALALGVGLAFAVPLNMFKVFGMSFEAVWAAKLLTGIAIGAGGSFLYDLVNSKK
jgi:hypothetical protein